MRKLLDEFFEKNDIRPEVVAEFAGNALMKICGQAGLGPVSRAVRDLERSAAGERKIKHPVVAAITEEGRGLPEE